MGPLQGSENLGGPVLFPVACAGRVLRKRGLLLRLRNVVFGSKNQCNFAENAPQSAETAQPVICIFCSAAGYSPFSHQLHSVLLDFIEVLFPGRR